MQLLLKEYPQAAREKTLDGWLPLHLVARYMGGMEGLQAMQLLLAEYPQAAKEKISDGWLPLHLVARYMGGAEGLQAIQLLLAEYPQAAREKTGNGLLSIHIICENNNGANLEMVRALLSAYPEGAGVTDITNPCVRAAHFNCLPDDAIDFLLRAQKGE